MKFEDIPGLENLFGHASTNQWRLLIDLNPWYLSCGPSFSEKSVCCSRRRLQHRDGNHKSPFGLDLFQLYQFSSIFRLVFDLVTSSFNNLDWNSLWVDSSWYLVHQLLFGFNQKRIIREMNALKTLSLSHRLMISSIIIFVSPVYSRLIWCTLLFLFMSLTKYLVPTNWCDTASS